ncbi:MAG: NB-ARC domain-containing protein [Anaerolineae bacterium]|nr:NB-ARC domain-containing protein [Anaerolineae bacterium]
MNGKNKTGLKLKFFGKSLQASYTPAPTPDNPQPAPIVIDLTDKKRQLLAYLAVNPGKKFHRKEIIGIIWGHSAELKDLLGSLRTLLSALNKDLNAAGASGYIAEDPEHTQLWFNKAQPHSIDVAEFRDALKNPKASVRDKMDLAELYQGEFLDDLFRRKISKKQSGEHDGEDFDTWLTQQQTNIQRDYERLMRQILSGLQQHKHWDELQTWADKWQPNCLEPEDQAALYGYRMRAAFGLGGKTALDAVYDDFKHSDLAENDWTIAQEVENLYAALQRSASNAPHIPIRLRQVPRFVGRNAVLDDVLACLSPQSAAYSQRVISISGLGGMGKTTLALRAAHNYMASPNHHFKEGAFYIALDHINQTEALMYAVAGTIGCKVYDHTDLQGQLLNFLRERAILLVLDGFENVLMHDKPAVLAFVSDVFHHAPSVTQLITTREKLNLTIEHAIELDGLDYPKHTPSEELPAANREDYSAVRLFRQVAKEANRHFKELDMDQLDDIVSICQLCEGMPLAILLAASNVDFLSPKKIATHIRAALNVLQNEADDLPKRQRSIQAVFESSWQLLADEERRVLAILSAFSDGFATAAAEHVAATDVSLLRVLARKSLIQQQQISLSFLYGADGAVPKVLRFYMHALLRRFVAEKLAANPPQQAQAKAALTAYYLQFAQNQVKPYKLLEPEWANLLDGMGNAANAQDWPTVLAYANALAEPWDTRGRYTDARTGFRWACEAAERLGDERALVKCLAHWGHACVRQGDYAEAEGYFKRGWSVGLNVGEIKYIGKILVDWAEIAIERADYVDADEKLNEFADMGEELHDESDKGIAYSRKSRIAYNLANFDKAYELILESLKYHGEGTQSEDVLYALRLFADITREIGYRQNDPVKLEESLAVWQKALDLCIVLGNKREEGSLYYIRAQHYRLTKDWSKMQQDAEKSMNLFKQVGDRKSFIHVNTLIGFSLLDQQKFSLAKTYILESIDKLKDFGDSLHLITPLYKLGLSYIGLKEFKNANSALQESYQLAKQYNHVLLQSVKDALEAVTLSNKTTENN